MVNPVSRDLVEVELIFNDGEKTRSYKGKIELPENISLGTYLERKKGYIIVKRKNSTLKANPESIYVIWPINDEERYRKITGNLTEADMKIHNKDGIYVVEISRGPIEAVGFWNDRYENPTRFEKSLFIPIYPFKTLAGRFRRVLGRTIREEDIKDTMEKEWITYLKIGDKKYKLPPVVLFGTNNAEIRYLGKYKEGEILEKLSERFK